MGRARPLYPDERRGGRYLGTPEPRTICGHSSAAPRADRRLLGLQCADGAALGDRRGEHCSELTAQRIPKEDPIHGPAARLFTDTAPHGESLGRRICLGWVDDTPVRGGQRGRDARTVANIPSLVENRLKSIRGGDSVARSHGASGNKEARRQLGTFVGAALIAGACLFAVAQSPAVAAKPATSAQKRAMAKAVPAATKFAGIPKQMRRCYSVDRSSAKRSTVNRSYRFGFVRYKQRATGPCSEEDASFSFYVYWRATASGLKPRGRTNQHGCFRGMKVPLKVQQEMLPNCPIS